MALDRRTFALGLGSVLGATVFSAVSNAVLTILGEPQIAAPLWAALGVVSGAIVGGIAGVGLGQFLDKKEIQALKNKEQEAALIEEASTIIEDEYARLEYLARNLIEKKIETYQQTSENFLKNLKNWLTSFTEILNDSQLQLFEMIVIRYLYREYGHYHHNNALRLNHAVLKHYRQRLVEIKQTLQKADAKEHSLIEDLKFHPSKDMKPAINAREDSHFVYQIMKLSKHAFKKLQ